MTETVVLMVAILVAALVMASGVWVAAVLTATVARAKRPAPSVTSRVARQTDP